LHDTSTNIGTTVTSHTIVHMFHVSCRSVIHVLYARSHTFCPTGSCTNVVHETLLSDIFVFSSELIAAKFALPQSFDDQRWWNGHFRAWQSDV